MIERIQLFLGPTMLRVLIAWIAITGFASLFLNSFVSQYDWVIPVQSLIVIIFLAGVVVIVLSRLSPGERGRWVAILLPVVIALFLALLVVPQWSGVLVGISVGWVIAALLLTRSRMTMEYREVIRHMRKNEYSEAVKIMDRVIRDEPNDLNHYAHHANILRLWGKFKLAIRDYQKMAQLAPTSPVGYNGLAEVYLQTRDYDLAQEAALKAQSLAPDDWVVYYNLGMIEDRRKNYESVIQNLTKALTFKIADARHRLLIHLYLIRAYTIIGQIPQAEEHLKSLKRQSSGLEEWQTILKSDQAATLREVIGKDIETALDLANGTLTIADLRKQS